MNTLIGNKQVIELVIDILNSDGTFFQELNLKTNSGLEFHL